MNKPPRKRKKPTPASSSDDTPSDNLTQEENPATATITVTAVEVPELIEEEQRDGFTNATKAHITLITSDGRKLRSALEDHRSCLELLGRVQDNHA
ncbi:hypothetical protein [Nostoc sphaeroides]|uniref:Uncharacterized protein n=1 Tax=Nostoc sphaeroides CCNUC1 TaxID=2653204 RepID=A0A5P8WHH6_9NOSO|nr:hypothetical protein [Nostoc sphaeroides]QFS52317.1 hypothetical protein GXM_09811 [Nostoc sphaeroides CCNUC1]